MTTFRDRIILALLRSEFALRGLFHSCYSEDSKDHEQSMDQTLKIINKVADRIIEKTKTRPW